MAWTIGNAHREPFRGRFVTLGLGIALAWALFSPSAPAQEPVVPPVVTEEPPETPPVPEPEAPDSPLAELQRFLNRPVLEAGPPVPIITSASRREERATAAPATVIVITRRDIQLRGYSQLIDVLRDLPGMETLEFFFSEFGTQVPIRGISGNNKIVLLVNGMRVNPPGGENFPFRSDFSVRHAERIEVVYGAGSTLYGADAISAVINVVTIDPAGGGEEPLRDSDDPLSFNIRKPPTSAGGESAEFGAQGGVNFEREIWGWYGGVLESNNDVKVSTYVQYHDSELTPLDRKYPVYWQDFRDIAAIKTNANGGGIVPDRSDYGLNIFGRVDWFQSSFQVWHRQSARNSAEGYSDILGFLPEGVWADSSTVMEGKNILDVTDNTTLESALTYNGYEIDPSSRYVFPNPTDNTKWFLNDFKYGRGWRLGLEETLRIEVSEDFSLLTGGIISYSDIVPKATIPFGFDPSQDLVTQGGSFFYSDVPFGPTTAIPRVSQVPYWTYAAYLEGQWQLLEDLRLVGGARITKDDHFEEIPITPRAAVIYNVSDRVTAKYMYTEAFVAPAPYFAFSVYDRGDILAQANPGVSPETAKTHEINLTYDRENVSLGAAAYYGTQGNLIIISDRNLLPNQVDDQVFLNGDPAQSRALVQTVNSGESSRYGADLYGKVTTGSFRSWFSYSYTDYEETTGGFSSGLPGISKHNGRLGTTCFFGQNLFITPSVVIRSTPENVLDEGRLAHELQTPWEINMYVLYRYSESTDMFLDLRNITDHDYALVSFNGSAYPQETFHGVAGVRVNY